jgi:hypothetical protein
MRVAMTAGYQAGIPKEEVDGWYGEVCLAEITVDAFFERILARMTDPELRAVVQAVSPRRVRSTVSS